MKKEYLGFQVPYPKDTFSVKVDEQWKSLEPKIKEFCAERQKDIDTQASNLIEIIQTLNL